MRKQTPVPHYEFVECSGIKAEFFELDKDNARHRATLRIPFKNRHQAQRTLCVIGQNPSDASESVADKTIAYLEQLIYHKYQEYTELLILNLYSRVDTNKTKADPLHVECDRIFMAEIARHHDFLLVFGKLENQKAYRFWDRAKLLTSVFVSKRVFKIDVDTVYAPHPGNCKILYCNFDVDLIACDFSTVVASPAL